MMHRKPLTPKQKAAIIARQDGKCTRCAMPLIGAIEFDHPHALELGGPDTVENREAIHSACHKTKTRADIKLIAKGRRIRKKLAGLVVPKRKIQSKDFDKRFTKKLRSGQVVARTGAGRMA